MDSLFSIVFGIGLRFVVDTVSHQDFKLTGTLVGLWEGVILLHFTKKTPKSSDPYIAFAVRLCVDFYLTESVARLVVGVLLAVAVAPSELNTASPIEPPTCWVMLAIEEATPVSCGCTPLVAAFCPGPKTMPSPRPITSSAGSTPPA